MDLEEALSEPPPPDIRPFGRLHPSIPSHDRAVNVSRTSSSPRQHVQSCFSCSPSLLPSSLFVAILAIAALPLASAQSHSDPFTSYPPPNTKTTPILNLLTYIFTSALDFLANLTGVQHVSAQGVHGLAKRLDQTGKIEAGMIPVLVALSGTFAGLTLGYVVLEAAGGEVTG